ncbi:hypothetical protein E8E14_008984 [Neopestalotiopsis sp. 37M]|nr:hypothetical protein E8E14_008984 [Neopestalotiopsis sp. 37M]
MTTPLKSRRRRNADTFQHARLTTKTSIRVIDLQPARAKDHPLELHIRQIELGEATDTYEALSYVWGSPTGSLPVLCLDDHENGGKLRVTPNCHNALLHLRYNNRIRTMWVDSICLDQTDKGKVERDEQVKRMGAIYREATRVVFWRDVKRRLVTLYRSVGEYVLKKTTSTERLISYRDALLELYKNEWFWRVWTFQEVAMARECIIVCGDMQIPWDALRGEWVGSEMLKLHGSIRQFAAAREAARGVLNYDRITHIKHISFKRWRTYSNRDDELTILKTMKNMRSTRPSDRIYGLYSIFEELMIRLPEADYDKPPSRVLEEFVMAHVRSRKTLVILTLGKPWTVAQAGNEGRSVFASAPSWVSGWITPENEEEAKYQGHLLRHFLMGRVPLDENFRASGINSEPRLLTPYAQHLISGLLRTMGKRLATVKLQWNCWDRNEASIKSIRTLRKWARSINAMQWRGQYKSQEALIGAALRAAVYPGFEQLRPPWSGEVTPRQWFDLLLYPHCNITPSSYIVALEEAFQSDPNNKRYKGSDDWTPEALLAWYVEQNPSASTWKTLPIDGFSLAQYIAVGNFLCGMSILSDSLMAVHSQGAVVGDEIFLLPGCDWPLLLRRQSSSKKSDSYKLVGPVIVPGAMEGQFWSDDDEEEQLQPIVLV